ncbi:hypothetical protein EON82_00200 [bacterium]|nr:MAG: hypothetical protein EON82_00200 [bacterium]
MSNDANAFLPGRWGFTRFASIGLAAILLAYGGNLLFREKAFDSDDAVRRAMADGWFPAEPNPSLGTPIYQWDPYIETDKPRLLGPVTKLNVQYHRQRLTQVKLTPHRNLLLDIKEGEQRYWVQK